MKVISKIGAVLMLALLLNACTKVPTAEFSVSSDDISIYDTVVFTNNSIDATSFNWDLGDGTIINSTVLENVSHIYTTSGTYTVLLKAANDKETVQYSKDIVVKDIPSTYTLEGEVYEIETEFSWYKSAEQDPYLRLEQFITGRVEPDLVRINPQLALGQSIAGTYTWDNSEEAGTGTYDASYVFNSRGSKYDSIAIAQDETSALMIKEYADSLYSIAGTFKLSVFDFDMELQEIVETSSFDLELSYFGNILPLDSPQ